LAILGDSVDTMGSQYITSPNPTPSSLSLSLSVSLPWSPSSPAHLSGLRLRSGTNEAPRCRNSLGAGVIAATAFLERVIVQQRRNGIARERSWLEGRQRDGGAWLKRTPREPMLKDPRAKRAITKMRNVARGAMHRGSHRDGARDWKCQPENAPSVPSAPWTRVRIST